MDKILLKKIKQIQWFHHIDLGEGIITPGAVNNFRTLKRLKIPQDLSGKTVLDIGAWDGFYSFEAEKRGAKRVLATDSYCWQKNVWSGKKGFELARKQLKSKVEDMNIDVMDLSSKTVGVFDLVLFLGVIYHLKNPLLALEKVFQVTKKHLILETHVDLNFIRRPVMVFYPGKELRNTSNNWWGPNPQAVVAMLKTVGFSRVEIVSRYFPFPLSIGAALYYKFDSNDSFMSTLQQDRIVVHAWK